MDNNETNKTILAADDSAVALALLSRLFKSAGYQVVTAADGIEAVQRAYGDAPDLIVLDITMPRMNGYQACRLLKHDPAVAHIPVIILTGADSRGTEFWSLHTGADAFLIKSAEPAELLATVATLLAQPSSSSGRVAASPPGPDEILSNLSALMDKELYATTIERIELKTILQNLRDGVLTLNLAGEVITVNPALCLMLGAEETELLRRPCAAVLDETAYSSTLEVFQAALAGHAGVERDSEIRHRAGQTTPVAISAVPLRDFLGETVGGVCLFHDITRRKESEALYEQMRALDKVKNDLTHMIVHDLRTPLTSLLGGLQTLEAVGQPREKGDIERELLDISIQGGETLLGMINDLLDISKMEAGAMQLERRELAAADVVEQAVQQVTALAAQQEMTIACECAAGLPRFGADEDKLRRTLVNLLGNAIKFTPVGGTITTSVRVSDGEEALLFSVRDTGEGVPTEDLDRIFEKFGQVENRKAGRKMSTGLGLTFCKMAVEAHGGRIWAESQMGQGSIFSFTIPLRFAALTDENDLSRR